MSVTTVWTECEWYTSVAPLRLELIVVVQWSKVGGGAERVQPSAARLLMARPRPAYGLLCCKPGPPETLSPGIPHVTSQIVSYLRMVVSLSEII